MKRIIQTIKLRKFKTEINKKYFENISDDYKEFLVWFDDNTCKSVYKDELIHVLENDHVKKIRYIFDMTDRIIIDRDILINSIEVGDDFK